MLDPVKHVAGLSPEMILSTGAECRRGSSISSINLLWYTSLYTNIWYKYAVKPVLKITCKARP